MRSLLFVTAALIAAPAAAQGHSSHAGHGQPVVEQDHSAHVEQSPTAPQEDHSAHAEHTTPAAPVFAPSLHEHGESADHAEEQEQPRAKDHGSMDHGSMDHDSMNHGSMKHGERGGMGHGAMDHEAMDHGSMGHAGHGAMDHRQMDHADHDAVEAAGDHERHEPPAPSAAPPPRAFEGPRHAADTIFGPGAMARARAENEAMDRMTFGTFMLERLEARVGEGRDHYLWDAQAWYGGDYDRLWVKSEGEGAFGGGVESAEVQALWSHAIGPFFDLQAGVRYDFEPDSRAHAVLGVQGLAPYMFEVDAAAFLSDEGDLTASFEAEYDQRITQRLILQPMVEVALAAQDIPERGIGAGVSSVETGLRLRYEFAREFAPYVGVGYEAKLGDTADFARAAGEDPDGVSLLIGLRSWF